jgi:enoyl-CoA hydratase/carnithine racemase
MACDMRFSTLSPSVQLAQIETSFGLNAGAGGALQLSRLIGLGRAFEYVFSSKDIDAKTAEQYGWINRAFPTSVEMYSYVQSLAQRIALFPIDGIVASKTGMNEFSRPDLETIVEDAQDKIAALTPEMVALATKFVEITGNQSIGKVELDYGDEVFALYNTSATGSLKQVTSRGCQAVWNMPFRVC